MTIVHIEQPADLCPNAFEIYVPSAAGVLPRDTRERRCLGRAGRCRRASTCRFTRPYPAWRKHFVTCIFTIIPAVSSRNCAMDLPFRCTSNAASSR